MSLRALPFWNQLCSKIARVVKVHQPPAAHYTTVASKSHHHGVASSSSIYVTRWKPWTPWTPWTPFQIEHRTFASKRHKNVIRQTKGFRGRANSCFTIAIRRLQKSWQHAYRDRKVQKRLWRKLWITRVNAGVRQYQIRYSQFLPAMKQANIGLNRKVLAELAANEPFSFKAVVDLVKHVVQQQKQHQGQQHQ